ncbi:MAG: acyl-CoA thioesterase FadM [Gammaproteobacteria bacterium]
MNVLINDRASLIAKDIQLEITSVIKLCEDQIDELGHLNHVSALKVLEYARDDWYQAAGLWEGRSWSADEALSAIVLNVNFNYRLECFSGETVTVKTRALNRGAKSFGLIQEISKEDGRIAIEGTATSLVMNLKEHQTLAVPDCLARFLAKRNKVI